MNQQKFGVLRSKAADVESTSGQWVLNYTITALL